ncbi:hypothetical protein [Anatilimnocola floriformis]|uniref:hypothetical protein n=1 Tax=Anatilimnocola floriformis TaxID=2948575 RepID=UPI0020C3D64A|nr:hypothetical protein [Anatilimnocola floriformis]
MRAYLTLAVAFAAAVCSVGIASAQCNSCGNGNGAGGCGPHGCRLHHHQKYIEGKDRGFNCSCQGSYNYPVPPLYTYHWPGMYKAERMTDYHSPFRFPPIKPFQDEVVAPALPAPVSEELPSELQPISHARPILGEVSTLGQPESMSNKLLQSFVR